MDEWKDSFIAIRLSTTFRFDRSSDKTVDFGWLSLLTALLKIQ